MLGRLRWITLGYHYDWTNRRYNEFDRSEFPPLLAHVARQIVDALRTELADGGLFSGLKNHSQLYDACAHFEPEAAIVNYYRGKTTMGFHTDEVEFDKQAPLVSVRSVSGSLRLPLLCLFFGLSTSVHYFQIISNVCF
ncbi:Alkylated DNA repair protein alkB 1 [Fasciolopsis buskii]|uniref:Alkylated DNA repair protein alkB 1 n=1 Tax=Fasciolopsis buskii TaxID=27845 RepID=A0A8E0RR84_9TREM|nr:Alkylated DNA repair protein alkB 1 [Fasciolopsis buski]